jgi:hypothetical protein
MMDEPIIGVGPNGVPQTARQAFAQQLDAAQAEWDLQATLPNDEPAGMSEQAREAYLQQRLVSHLGMLLGIGKKLPPETFK